MKKSVDDPNTQPLDWLVLVEDLQQRVAFQEDALQVMSDQMALQDKTLRETQWQIAHLKQKILDMEQAMEQGVLNSGLERPPHY